VINPATPAGAIEEILPDVGLVLVMTVNPGFGGQQFIEGTLPKIRKIRRMIDEVNPSCELEVDGGIDAETLPHVVAAGARVLVAGTAVFGDPGGITEGIRKLTTAASACSAFLV
jgi:ribulose-phosphate 3-epimerase